MTAFALALGNRTFRSLRRHRNYRLFFTGQIVSVAGTWMQNIALAWLVMVALSSEGWQGSPPWAVLLGLVLTATGLSIHGMGIRDVVRYGSEGTLVDRGVYSKMRHPIYYGWVMVSFGLPVVLGSELGLWTAPLWSGAILLVALLEERDLMRSLPPGVYAAYKERTWF